MARRLIHSPRGHVILLENQREQERHPPSPWLLFTEHLLRARRWARAGVLGTTAWRTWPGRCRVHRRSAGDRHTALPGLRPSSRRPQSPVSTAVPSVHTHDHGDTHPRPLRRQGEAPNLSLPGRTGTSVFCLPRLARPLPALPVGSAGQGLGLPSSPRTPGPGPGKVLVSYE